MLQSEQRLPEPFGEPVARQQTGLVVTLEAAYNGEGCFASGVAGKEGQAGFVVELEAWGTILRKRKIMLWYKLLPFWRNGTLPSQVHVWGSRRGVMFQVSVGMAQKNKTTSKRAKNLKEEQSQGCPEQRSPSEPAEGLRECEQSLS